MAIGGVLFDIDGVLVTSWKPIEGAAETLQVMACNQIACSYLTNTTTRTRVQIAELLTQAGMQVRADEVITAAVLTAEYVRNRYPDARCFLVNSGQIGEDMPGIDIAYSSDFTGPKAPEQPVDHDRRVARGHRQVPDRDGGDLWPQGDCRRQAGARRFSRRCEPPRCRSRRDVHDRRRPHQRCAGRAGRRDDRGACAHRKVP